MSRKEHSATRPIITVWHHEVDPLRNTRDFAGGSDVACHRVRRSIVKAVYELHRAFFRLFAPELVSHAVGRFLHIGKRNHFAVDTMIADVAIKQGSESGWSATGIQQCALSIANSLI